MTSRTLVSITLLAILAAGRPAPAADLLRLSTATSPLAPTARTTSLVPTATRTTEASPLVTAPITVPSGLAPRVADPVLRELRAGRPQRVIVELEAAAVREEARLLRRARRIAHDDAVVRAFKADAYEALRRAALDRLAGVRLVRAYRHLPIAVAVVEDERALAALLARPAVRAVRENEEAVLHRSESLPLVNQPRAGQNRIRGGGVGVAVIDTGVDWSQPEFGGCTGPNSPASCRIAASVEIAADDGAADDGGHGTNVAAIVAAVAPRADVVVLDVFFANDAGEHVTNSELVSEAIDWVIEHRDAHAIRVMNLSLGRRNSHEGQACESSYEAAFAEAADAGIVPIVSAGNDGFHDGVAVPACSRHAVSVGAVYDADFGDLDWGVCFDNDPRRDTVVCFSQSGPNLDLLAPGSSILAGGIEMSGTSQAAPHVAGAWALLLSARPELSHAQTLALLQASGRPIADRRNGLTRSRIDVAAALGLSAIEGVTEAGDRFGDALATGDFDGDGRVDLAIGVPGEDVGSIADAGAVNVLYGHSEGLGSARNQIWDRNREGLPGVASAHDRFGSALATGDFDCDGFDDLAIGVPGADISSRNDAGAVVVLRGSAHGLTTSGARLWHQDVSGVEGVAEAGDRFGSALASGDFDGDGCADLAVGVPDEDVGSLADAGAVNVLRGSPNGLTATGDQIWDQNSSGIADAAEADDRFGFALAAGDFDGDGRDDLAIGVPREDKDLFSMDHGAVHVLYGSASGLTAARSQLWTQDSSGVEDVLEGGDQFGYALVAGDFDGDGRDDLAIGVPFEDRDLLAWDTGAVNVLYGTSTGLSAARDQLWTQDAGTIAGVGEGFDEFGRALAAGDFDGDGRDDLVVGVPGEDVNGSLDAGSVNVIRGGSTGLTSERNVGHSQASPGIAGELGWWDGFGSAVAVGDFDGDGRADLAVGVPQEDVNGDADAGAVHILYGTATGLTTVDAQVWDQDR